MSAAPALELDGVNAAYGPFRALFGISLTVPDGGSVALIGPNGSRCSGPCRLGTTS